MTDIKPSIQTALGNFSRQPLAQAATGLFDVLGYRSEKKFPIVPNSGSQFRAEFDPQNRLIEEKARIQEWRSVDILFQLTDDEIRQALGGQAGLFTNGKIDGTLISSYLVFAIELDGAKYSRTHLANITRQVNLLFPMPVLILFRHGETLSLGIITRRLNKRDASRDVLEKVTLIKDVRAANPHRAHLEILEDLSLPALASAHHLANFADLQRAWEKTLDTTELNKKFYREVANWYFWAVRNVQFPVGAGADEETRNATAIIRLITRLIFVWFIKEKGLVPEDLFNPRRVSELLLEDDRQDGWYYRAILQNLFFATLNTEMGSQRKFRIPNVGDNSGKHHGDSTVYRYQERFRDAQAALKLFSGIPFLNGGLFECLDKPDQNIYVDGFSDTTNNQPSVPDALFFGGEREEDLSDVLGDNRRAHEKVRGLIHIFNSYKFTVEENTPIEEEIALDPELLGKVFENLLAAYNPETGTTARKQTGSFYTPREIVNYMVDEALIAYLESSLGNAADTQIRLRQLLAYTDKSHEFSMDETARLIEAIDSVKVLDPAAGSGAFPMGVLHKLVFILGKLDPGNQGWKDRQIEKVVEIPDATVREKALSDIEQAFADNELDYGRKLYLIENGIYGVDIQPIAVQIAKLRFFISLVVEQKIDRAKPNLGIRPLPNLETKFVAANTLIGIEKPAQLMFRNPAIDAKEKCLREVRGALFTAKTPATKKKYREQDKQLRTEIAELLKKDGWGSAAAAQLAGWDPYDQNTGAGFFDPEWMFGITGGFDVVIGNPPYVDSENMVRTNAAERIFISENYETTKGNWDLYIPFWEKSIKLCSLTGIATLITPNKWLSIAYGKSLRQYCQDLLYHIVDYSKFRAFDEAGIFTVVAFMSPVKHNNLRITSFVDKDSVAFDFLLPSSILLQFETWGIFLSNNLPQVLKMIDTRQKLGDLCSVEEPFTVSEAYLLSDIMIEEEKADSKYFYFANTGTIDPYVSLWGQKLTTYLKTKYVKPVIPEADMERNFPRRYRQSKDCKILISGIRHFESFLDDQGQWVSGKSTVILRGFNDGIDPKFLLGVLNSKLITFYLKECYGSLSMDGGINFSPSNVSQIPICGLDRQNKLVTLVENILLAKRANPAADTGALEAEIDRLVYQVYGLTEDEIAIVEGRTGAIRAPVLDIQDDITTEIPVIEVDEEDSHEPAATAPGDYGLYKCGICGKMVTGFMKGDHVQDDHRGKTVEWQRIGK